MTEGPPKGINIKGEAGTVPPFQIAAPDTASSPKDFQAQAIVVEPKHVRTVPLVDRSVTYDLETESGLSPTQKLASGIGFHSWLVERFQTLAEDQLPQLRHEASKNGELKGRLGPDFKRDKKLKGKYVGHLLDAYADIERREKDPNPDPLWKHLDDEYTPIVRSMRREIEENKTRINTEAKKWDVDDEIKQIGKAYNLAKTGSREVKDSVYKQFQFYSNSALENTGRYAGMTTATVAGSQIEQWLAIGSGIGMDKFLHLGDVDWKVTGSALALSYVVFFWAMNKNTNVNHELVEETGLAQRTTSAAAYDLVRSQTDNKTLQKFASKIGYMIPEIQFEIGAAVAAASPAFSYQEAIGFMIGANLVGIGWEGASAKYTKDFMHYKQARLRKKVLKRHGIKPQSTDRYSKEETTFQ